ncbi:MAG: WecB/TagA/CpsF family glycosyltransferase [Sporomusaceae bacterium]|nr:WecB/TagA/CpsF family glycosyltransferase [Sporomusaceae bacterium]
MQNKVSILGIPVDAVTMEEALTCVEAMVAGKPKETEKLSLIATANAEMVMMAQEDQELASILSTADLVVPDGAGVVWAASYLGKPVPERVAGFDLAQRLFAISAKTGYRLYFLGGAPGVAAKAAEKARELYPGITIVGIQDGYFKEEETKSIIDAVNKSKAELLFVALGVPKQEKWIEKHRNELAVRVAIGVGGTFDVMAGVMERAPLWMQEARLEWLFRLFKQPSRFMRMMALPKFVLKVRAAKKN